METPLKKIIWEFEVLRALAIIFVVLSHVDIMLSHINGCISSDSYQAIIKAVSVPIGETGNCLFFFISGYLLYTNNGRITDLTRFYYIGSAEGHEYPNLQVGDEVDPRLSFCVNSKSINSCFF